MKKLLINLTNHPSQEWNEEQLKAAHSYGEIEDMEFPTIPPYMGEDEIEKVIKKYEQIILKKSEVNLLTVHIMGEQTFCYGLINRLTKHRIRCMASCTERGTFKFVRFREYVSPQ